MRGAAEGEVLPRRGRRGRRTWTITVRRVQRRRLNPNRPQTRFIKLSREVTQEFVRHAECNDTEQGKEQGPGSADVPPAEDDAEILCVPCEQHVLPSTPFHCWEATIEQRAGSMSMSSCPWSIPLNRRPSKGVASESLSLHSNAAEKF